MPVRIPAWQAGHALHTRRRSRNGRRRTPRFPMGAPTNRASMVGWCPTCARSMGRGADKPAETPGTEASSPAASGPPAVPDEANGGMITGKVAFTGEKPKMPVLDMSANPACERAHKGVEPESEEVIVNRNGTLKNVFVWVKSGLPAGQRWGVPATAVTVDQNGCMYRPRVAGVMTGQSLQITNSDPTNHNIHPQPRVNPEWNESQSPQQAAVTKTFGRQEVMIPVKCNV